MLAMVLLVGLTACVDEGDGSGPLPPGQRPPLNDAENDTGNGGGNGDGEDTGEVEEAIPLEEACHPDIEAWPGSWSTLEERVLEKVNERRAQGADCRSGGSFGPAAALEMEPTLRCAARYHSLWMAQSDVMSHDSPGGDLGDDPWQRMANAGFSGSPVGENVAAGYDSAGSVVSGWMQSDGHCANIMNPDARLLGVGYAQGGSYGHYWTQAFGR